MNVTAHLAMIGSTTDDRQALQVVIEPSTTVADILRQANLHPGDYEIQVRRGSETLALGLADRVYDYVMAGEKIVASPGKIDVGVL
jgi:hypothetical protein